MRCAVCGKPIVQDTIGPARALVWVHADRGDWTVMDHDPTPEDPT